MSDPAESDLKLEIAHVLLIDVVGYSKLLVNDQIQVLETLNAIVRNTPHFRTAEASGKLMRLPTGDGMALLFFDSPEAPVECALEIAHAAKGRPELQLRMGAHSGPIKQVNDVNDRPNYAGAGINMAQRVLDCGDCGHILLSKRLAEDLAAYRHWHPHLHDLGECEVKHGVKMHLVNLCKDGVGNPAIPEKIRLQQQQRTGWKAALKRTAPKSEVGRRSIVIVGLLAASAITVGLWLLNLPPSGRSIAVLPFETDANADASFAKGVELQIHSNLTKVSAFQKVADTSSAKQFLPQNRPDIQTIATALGVSHLVNGSVQQRGNQVLVRAELVDVPAGKTVWSGYFDGDLADFFSMQSEIAERVVKEMRLKLLPEEKATLNELPTRNRDAVKLYTQARASIEAAVFSATANEDLRRAVDILIQAVAVDPDFGLAYYQLAHAQDQLYLRFDRTAARKAAAEAAIRRLEQLLPASGEAHLARAKHLYWAEGQYDRARRELAIAQRALPHESLPALLTGYIDRRQGRWEDSTRNLYRAFELDPQNPLTLQQLSITYFAQRRFPEMAATLDRAVELALSDVVPRLRLQRAAVDLHWRADTKPLHEFIEAARRSNPASVHTIADQWIDLAFHERDPAAAEQALANLSADGCQIGPIPFPRSWCEGVTARMRGDEAAARNSFGAVLAEAKQSVRNNDSFAGAFCVMGMAHAALNEKEEAIHAGRRAVELQPVSSDALNGPLLVGYLAIIYAWVGEKDLALEQLEAATTIPSYWSYGTLVLHPYWDPLRNEARFEKIVASLAPTD